MSKIIAVIVAGGSGRRFGGKKQFLEINGKPLYYYSLKAFEGIADRMVLVVPEEDADSIDGYGADVIAGGVQRYNSVYNAVKYLDSLREEDEELNEELDESIILIHDAARPMITGEVIERVIEDTRHHVAAVATVPVVDTIRTKDGKLLDRNTLRAMQTPQSFKYCILKLAFDMFMSLSEEEREAMNITDDVEVVKRTLGMNSFMSEGSVINIKVTTKEDLDRIRFS